ncbi:hopanoid-associated sugar epimerase [Aphanothece sacrum]|uniref:Nucleoside-diphosphate-sugar epimerase-like protein n=1 Tax=Aphanothece sacrum FPU1 TaxID=1920663 RepID=A0A401INL4_APHSA|nr:hopanoid-associated sugar epimerase [Aphanothece sacrum]GBF82831.1 nucleoside-diphosphate-sugar epimerase-like protein [Aphanothece sacrum FPU1]GBF85934.1 nucleoside-diphosphate-sugar epimerase-like protein [Aphanothece sacrum FPU3]
MTIKAFVTGGTGFIGANLVRFLLEEGYQVCALVRPQSCLDNLKNLDMEIVKSDLNDPNLSNKMKGCQVLFHVAAHYSLYQSDKDQLYQSNVLGTRSILTAAKQAGIERIVYTSSVAAIGVGNPGEIVNETHQSPVEKLVGHYKKSKYWAEQEAYKAVKKGQDIVIVNPSTPVGPWDIKPTPTGEIILRFLRRQMPAYVNTGLNLIDVRDVARGHLLALEKGKTGERYILGNHNLTFKALLDELSNLTGLNSPQQTLPLWLPLSIAWMEEYLLAPLGKKPLIPIDGVRMSKQPMYYDASKAINELGLSPSPIKKALQDAINWFIDYGYIK